MTTSDQVKNLLETTMTGCAAGTIGRMPEAGGGGSDESVAGDVSVAEDGIGVARCAKGENADAKAEGGSGDEDSGERRDKGG